MDTQITKELVEKYLQGNCTPQEKAQVETYIQKGGNLSVFETALEDEWTNMDDQPSADIDTEDSLQKFKAKRQQLDMVSDTAKQVIHFYLNRYKRLLITALFLIILSVFFLGYI
ncbi:hypothetical protein QNI16_31165 [Cytophagaceae bacterium YF14B1]|uniref:Uncharacterized protein n=1 Tax=Xanthocytophaga flava TaxID=3048013 RepID=A0AAE3QU48_9BACT|nr:hypothetical protein [Xanthocytophaga flavus]MDJ1466991.1 hypothetical protein [Xanthocytophaga flavus]MDJ1485001.1 hypothetical protein [Xanthocytophaga flavus]